MGGGWGVEGSSRGRWGRGGRGRRGSGEGQSGEGFVGLPQVNGEEAGLLLGIEGDAFAGGVFVHQGAGCPRGMRIQRRLISMLGTPSV